MGVESTFNTNNFFVGGNGMFIQYHDIIKPAKLYAVFKMIFNNSYGLPVNIIKQFSIPSILEWYINRSYINPLKQLDYLHKLKLNELDDLLLSILRSDKSIYTLSPELHICRLFSIYRQQHMIFPIFIYSEDEEEFIKYDCEKILSGINFKYVYGDLKECISKCDNNFTYIFSNIETMYSSINILRGTYSHILLANDYRYNYANNKLKYDLHQLMLNNPIIRTGTINAIENINPNAFSNITIGG